MPYLTRRVATACVAAAMVASALSPAMAQSTPGGAPPPVAFARPMAISPTAPIVLSPAQAELLQRALVEAEKHGFEPGEFAPRGGGDAALVEAAVRYARAVKTGRLAVEGFRDDWGLRPMPFDARGGLARAVYDDGLEAWLKSLPPDYPGYETLQVGLATYRGIRARGGWQMLAEGPDLKLGSTGPAVEALRARLAIEDPGVPLTVARVPIPPVAAPAAPAPASAVDLPPAGAPLFDMALAEAVKRAQKRMGLEPSGVVGTATRLALNIPVQRRIDQIVANMERWRWLPPTMPADRAQVNVAAGVLTLYKNDQATLSMRAVTGRPNGGETPLLSSTIDSIVLNPPWNVPAGIAARELMPKGRAYLASAGFRILPGGGLQQAPGPGSALGLIKFDFLNPYAVYLHDTPSKGGFSRYTRLASHGCVRLERPLALARAIMEGDPYWTPEQIDATIAGGKTTRAQVARPVAVFLLYWTAYVTPDGQVNFRQDPYGWDTLLIERIAAQGRPA
ncbi:MAG: L,D-transpeptidase family protein [Caulobacterales bacterium]|nr:L,D-transpeptidase family protein [Caulobacterales bacterium]